MMAKDIARILEQVMTVPPSKTTTRRPSPTKFNYDTATPAELDDAVSNIRRLLGGGLRIPNETAAHLLAEIDVSIERIVTGKLPHFRETQEIKQWFLHGTVRSSTDEAISMSRLNLLIKKINGNTARLDELKTRVGELEAEKKATPKRSRTKKAATLIARSHDKIAQAEETLVQLIPAFRDQLTFVAMLVAQE